MIEVFYKSPKGASIGRTFPDQASMEAFVKKLRKPARIMVAGEHVGRVWQMDDGRWSWYFEPDKVAAHAPQP